MHLVVQRQRIQLQAGVWISPEDIMRKAIAASVWPRCKVYIDWGFGKEPIHTPAELAFAARLVHAYHCFDIPFDYHAAAKRRGNSKKSRRQRRVPAPVGGKEERHRQELVAMLGRLTPPTAGDVYDDDSSDGSDDEGDSSAPDSPAHLRDYDDDPLPVP